MRTCDPVHVQEDRKVHKKKRTISTVHGHNHTRKHNTGTHSTNSCLVTEQGTKIVIFSEISVFEYLFEYILLKF